MKYIKTYNESIKHLLKPKSKEDVIKQLSKLSPLKQIEKSITYDILDRDELRKILFKLNDEYIIHTGLEYDLLNNDEILKYSKKLSREQKLAIGTKYDILPLVKLSLKKPSFFSFNDEELHKNVIYDGFVTACSMNNIEVVKYYLDGIIENVSFNKNSVIKSASEKGHLEVIKLLLNHDTFNLNINDDIYIIYSAAKNGHYNIVDFLLKDNRFKNIKFPQMAIENLIYSRNYDNLKKLLEYKEITKNLPNHSKFYYGCKYGILYLVKDAIKEGYKPKLPFDIVYGDERTKMVMKSPEVIAIQNGYTEIVEYILDNTYFDPSDYGNILIKIAYTNKRHEIIDMLLRDKRVSDKLENHEKDFLENEISHLYESITHLLKPKSEEEIVNSTKNLDTRWKIHYGIKYDIPFLIKQAIIEGHNTGLNNQILIRFIFNNGYDDILTILLENYKGSILNHTFYSLIQNAIINGQLNIIKVLMNDKRFNLSFDNNSSIRLALAYGHIDIVQELLKDKRVVDKLSVEDKVNIETELGYRYKSMINNINNWIEKRKKELE